MQCTKPLRDMQALGRRASCKEDNERKDREDWAYMQVILAHFPAYPNTYLSLYKTYLPACLPACLPTFLSYIWCPYEGWWSICQDQPGGAWLLGGRIWRPESSFPNVWLWPGLPNLKLLLSSPLACFPQDGVVSLKEACGMLRCVGFGHHVNIL